MTESLYEPSHNFVTMHRAYDVAMKILGYAKALLNNPSESDLERLCDAMGMGYNKNAMGTHYGRYFRVVRNGPGVVSHGQQWQLPLEDGDVVVASLQMRNGKVDVFGDELQDIGTDHIVAMVKIIEEPSKSMELIAMQDYVLTIEDDEAHERIMRKDGAMMHIPLETLRQGQLSSDVQDYVDDPNYPGGKRPVKDAHKFGVRTKFERVISVGPGKWLDGMFQELPYGEGDMIAFMPATTITFLYGGGLTVRAVPYKAIRGRIPGAVFTPKNQN